MRVSSSDSSLVRSIAEVRSNAALLISSTTTPERKAPRREENKQKQSELSRREGGKGRRKCEQPSPGWMKDRKRSRLAQCVCDSVHTLNAGFAEWVSGSTGRVSRFPHSAPTWISSYIKMNREKGRANAQIHCNTDVVFPWRSRSLIKSLCCSGVPQSPCHTF